MLRNLFDEIVRRRLWPILAIAVLVAVAAPVLFLKPAADDAPPASMAAPAAAPAGELPARAQRLISGRDAATAASRRTASRRSDPFQAPSSHTAATSATAGSSEAKRTSAAGSEDSSAASSGATQPSPASGSGSAPAPTVPAGEPRPIGDDGGSSLARRVDVRFGERMPARLHRGIPRGQTFLAGGRVVAIFLKYSPTRDKAVFAIAPGTLIDGTIECRRKEGLCRYVDIPAGKGVRLITRGNGGTIVARRLDVVRIVRPSRSGATTTASSAPVNAACLLGKMLALKASDMPPAGDACTS